MHVLKYIHEVLPLLLLPAGAGIGRSGGGVDGRGVLLSLGDRAAPQEVRPLRRLHRQVEEEGRGAAETVPGPQPGE